MGRRRDCRGYDVAAVLGQHGSQAARPHDVAGWRGTTPLDVHLGGYVKAGGGWLATKIEMFQGGVRRQAEEYSDWKVDVPVDPAMFDVTKWTTAPHWAKTAK